MSIRSITLSTAVGLILGGFIANTPAHAGNKIDEFVEIIQKNSSDERLEGKGIPKVNELVRVWGSGLTVSQKNALMNLQGTPLGDMLRQKGLAGIEVVEIDEQNRRLNPAPVPAPRTPRPAFTVLADVSQQGGSASSAPAAPAAGPADQGVAPASAVPPTPRLPRPTSGPGAPSASAVTPPPAPAAASAPQSLPKTPPPVPPKPIGLMPKVPAATPSTSSDVAGPADLGQASGAGPATAVNVPPAPPIEDYEQWLEEKKQKALDKQGKQKAQEPPATSSKGTADVTQMFKSSPIYKKMQDMNKD